MVEIGTKCVCVCANGQFKTGKNQFLSLVDFVCIECETDSMIFGVADSAVFFFLLWHSKRKNPEQVKRMRPNYGMNLTDNNKK